MTGRVEDKNNTKVRADAPARISITIFAEKYVKTRSFKNSKNHEIRKQFKEIFDTSSILF